MWTHRRAFHRALSSRAGRSSCLELLVQYSAQIHIPPRLQQTLKHRRCLLSWKDTTTINTLHYHEWYQWFQVEYLIQTQTNSVSYLRLIKMCSFSVLADQDMQGLTWQHFLLHSFGLVLSLWGRPTAQSLQLRHQPGPDTFVTEQRHTTGRQTCQQRRSWPLSDLDVSRDCHSSNETMTTDISNVMLCCQFSRR